MQPSDSRSGLGTCRSISLVKDMRSLRRDRRTLAVAETMRNAASATRWPLGWALKADVYDVLDVHCLLRYM